MSNRENYVCRLERLSISSRCCRRHEYGHTFYVINPVCTRCNHFVSQASCAEKERAECGPRHDHCQRGRESCLCFHAASTFTWSYSGRDRCEDTQGPRDRPITSGIQSHICRGFHQVNCMRHPGTFRVGKVHGIPSTTEQAGCPAARKKSDYRKLPHGALHI